MKNQTLNHFSMRSLNRSFDHRPALLPQTQTRFQENLGTLRSRASFTDEVTNAEPNAYLFRLQRRTTLTVSLENQEKLNFLDLFGTKKRVQARLLNIEGNTLRSTARIRPDDSADFRVRLNPGTYAVRITGRSENEVEYRLRLSISNNGFNFDDHDNFDFSDSDFNFD